MRRREADDTHVAGGTLRGLLGGRHVAVQADNPTGHPGSQTADSLHGCWVWSSRMTSQALLSLQDKLPLRRCEADDTNLAGGALRGLDPHPSTLYGFVPHTQLVDFRKVGQPNVGQS